MRVAIIGLPMSGKTSLFRLLTGAPPGEGGARSDRVEQRQVKVRDHRLERLAEDFHPAKVTPISIDLLDFPAIPRPGEEGRRSLAELLGPARDSAALLLVVRAFEDPALPPLGGSVDPARELEEIVEELRIADLEVALGRRERAAASLRRKQGAELKALGEEISLLERITGHLESGGDIHELPLGHAEEKSIRGFQFLSAKPQVVVENLGEPGEGRIPGAIAAAIAIELELEELDEEARALFAEEYGVASPSRDPVIEAILQRAGLVTFYTTNENEVRAWAIPEGTPAVQAAASIHSDISRGFIRAEVVGFADYVADGAIHGAREKGHLRLEGKEYPVTDGDIIFFRFSV